MKVTFMGAGSTVFAKNVLGDILLCKSLTEDLEIALYDIDAARLEESYLVIDLLNKKYNEGKARIGRYLGVEQRRELPFSRIWHEAAESAAFHLSEQELSQLDHLGNVLGRYDAASQCAALRETRERLNRLLEDAQAQTKSAGRIYKTMGVASGALLAVVLL